MAEWRGDGAQLLAGWHKKKNDVKAVFSMFSNLIKVKTGPTTSYWSIGHIRRNKWLTAVFPVLILILSMPYKHPIGWTGAPAGPIACRSHSVPNVDHCPKCGPFTVRKIPPERPSKCRLPWSALLCRSHAHDRRVSTFGCPSFHATHAEVANEQAHLGKILPFFVVDCEPHGNALVYPHIRRRARPRYAMGQPADSRYARQVAGDGGRDRQSQRRPFDAHVPGGGGVPGGVEQREGQRHR